MIRVFVAIGGLFSLAAVISRALSSHKIRPLLTARGTLDNFNLASDYLLLHGIALIGVGVMLRVFPEAPLARAGYAFILGSVLFQGSVMVKSLVGLGPLGMITPLGGLCLMTGWVLLTYAGLRL